MAAGHAVVIDDAAFGWPARKLSQLPAGDYLVQAVLNRYETFHMADGRVLKLAPDKGEGQQWALKPGNLYSTAAARAHRSRSTRCSTPLALEQRDRRRSAPRPTRSSSATSASGASCCPSSGDAMSTWARTCSCPKDFDKHPEAHYPLMVFHGHYPDDISDFRTTPPDADLKPDYSERFHLAGYNRIQQQESYAFYQKWISADFPRFLVVEIEHANPYYDDSYAVNSANLGPYGDAINKELIPEIERRFRGIGAGWARFTYGGSTGGWEALATQVFYPDMYNGAFAACPDPIDFRAYTIINIYEDPNAYALKGEAVERRAARDPQLPGRGIRHPARRQLHGARAGGPRPLGRPVRHLGGRVRAGRQGRLSAAALRQAHVATSTRGRRLLARALRSVAHHRARLGDACPEAAGQDPHLRGQRRHLST